MFSSWFGSSSGASSTTNPAASSGAASSHARPAGTSSSSSATGAAARASESVATRQKRLLETVFQSTIENLLLEATKHRSLVPLREVALLTRQHHYPPLELFQTLVFACDLCTHGKTTRPVLLQCLSDIGKLASLGLMPITPQVVLAVCDLVRRFALQMHQGSVGDAAESTSETLHAGATAAAAASSPSTGAQADGSTGTTAPAPSPPAGLSSVMVSTQLLVADEELLVRLAQLVMAFLSACPADGHGLPHLLGVLLVLYAGSSVQSMLEATCDVAITQRLISTFEALCSEDADGLEEAGLANALTPQLRAVSLLKDVCSLAVGKPPRWIDLQLSLNSQGDGTDGAATNAAGSGDARGRRRMPKLQHVSESDEDDEDDAAQRAQSQTNAAKRGSSTASNSAHLTTTALTTPSSPVHSALHPGIAFLDDDDSAELLRSGGGASGVAAATSEVTKEAAQSTEREGEAFVMEEDGKAVPMAQVEAPASATTRATAAPTTRAEATAGGAKKSGAGRSEGPLVIKVTSAPHRLRVLLMRTLIQFFGSATATTTTTTTTSSSRQPEDGQTTARVVVPTVNPLLAQCLNEDVVGLALDCPHYLDPLFVLQALREQRVVLHQHNRHVFARRRGGQGDGGSGGGAVEDDVDESELDVFHVALVDFTSGEGITAGLQAASGHAPHAGTGAAEMSRAQARLVEQAEEQFILSQRLLILALTRYAQVMRRAAGTVLSYHTSIIQESRTSGGTNAQATMIVLTLWRKAMVEEGLLTHLLSLAPAEPIAPPTSPSQDQPSWMTPTAAAPDAVRPPIFLSMVLECTAQLNEVMRAAEEAVYRREEERRRAWREEANAAASMSGHPEETAGVAEDFSRTGSIAPSPLTKSISLPAAPGSTAEVPTTATTATTATPPSAPALAEDTTPPAAPDAAPSSAASQPTPSAAHHAATSSMGARPPPPPRPVPSRRRRKIVLAHPAAEYQQDLMGFLSMFGQSFAHLVDVTVNGGSRTDKNKTNNNNNNDDDDANRSGVSSSLGVPQLRDSFMTLHVSLLTCTTLSTRQMMESGDDVLHLSLKASSHWVQVCCLLGLTAERDLYLRALVAAIASYNPLLAELTDTLCAMQEDIEQRVGLENDELVTSAAAPSSVSKVHTSAHTGSHGGGGELGRGGGNHSAASQLKRWGGQFAQNVRRLTGLETPGVGGPQQQQQQPHSQSQSHQHHHRPTSASPQYVSGSSGSAASVSEGNASAPSAVPITIHTILVALEQRLSSRSSQEAVRDGVRLLQRRLVMLKTLFSIGSTLGEALEATGWAILGEGFSLIEWLAHRMDLLTHCIRDATVAEEQRRQLNSDVKHLRDALRMVCLNNVSRLSLGTFRVLLTTLLDECTAVTRTQMDESGWGGGASMSSSGRRRAGPWRSPPPPYVPQASTATATAGDGEACGDLASIIYPAFMTSSRANLADRRCMAWEAQNRSSCFSQWRLTAQCFGLVFVSLITSTNTVNTATTTTTTTSSADDDEVQRRLLAQYAAVAWEAMHTLYQRVTQRAHLAFWIQFFMRSPLHAALSNGGADAFSRTTDKAGISGASGSAAASGTGAKANIGGGDAQGHGAAGRTATRSAAAAGIGSSASISTNMTGTTDLTEAAAAALGLLPAELRSLDVVLFGMLEDLVATAAVSAVLWSRPDVLDRAPSSPSARADSFGGSLSAQRASQGTPTPSLAVDGAAMREGEAKIAAAMASSAFLHTAFVQLVIRLVPFRRADGPYRPSATTRQAATDDAAAERSSALATLSSPQSQTRLPRGVTAVAQGHTVVLLEGPFALVDELYASFQSWAVESPLRTRASPPTSPLLFPSMRAPAGLEAAGGGDVASDAVYWTDSVSQSMSSTTAFGRLTGRLHRLPLVILATRSAAVLLQGNTQLVQCHSEDLQGGVWVPVIRVLQCTASSASRLGLADGSSHSTQPVPRSDSPVPKLDTSRHDALVKSDVDEEAVENDEEDEVARAAVAELWPSILARLTAHATESVSLAFRSVEAIQHDNITMLNVQGLLQLARCAAAFMRYHIVHSEDARLHINLSAVQLLWSLADFMAASDLPAVATEELWCSVLLQLYEGCIDDRQEVRQSAQKTFFALVLTHGALFTGDAWRCVLLSVLAPMMGVLLEGLPGCAIAPPAPPPQPSSSPAVSAPTHTKVPLTIVTAATAPAMRAEALSGSHPRVSQAVAQVLQYGGDQARRHRVAALIDDDDDANEDGHGADDDEDDHENDANGVMRAGGGHAHAATIGHTTVVPASTTSPAEPAIRGGSSTAELRSLRGAAQPARVRAAQRELLRVLTAAPKQLDEMRVSLMDGATRVLLAHADNMLIALARSVAMPSVASTSTAPAPSFAAVSPVEAEAATHGEGAALVEAVVSCFIQFCGEAVVVVRDTSGEEAALAAVHALHGLMVESPLPGGLSPRCTLLAWSALKQLVLRDPSTRHTAKKQCTVNVVAGVEAALCDDVCLQRSLLLEYAQANGGGAIGEDSAASGMAAPSSPLLLHRGGAGGFSSFRAPATLSSSFAAGAGESTDGSSGASSTWRARRRGLGDMQRAASTATVGSLGSPLFPVAGVAHRRGSAVFNTETPLAVTGGGGSSYTSDAAVASGATSKTFFYELVTVLKHCVSCEAAADAYFFPNKVQTTLVEGLQALWPLLSPAEAQTMLEAVVLPQFPSYKAVADFVLQDIAPSEPESLTGIISLRRCLPPGSHPNALLLYLDLVRDCLTSPTAAAASASLALSASRHGFVSGGSSSLMDLAHSQMDDEDGGGGGGALAAAFAEHAQELQRLAAPAVLRAVGHLLGLQYASPAVVAAHDPGTVFNVPDGFFARVYDTLLFVVWDVALATPQQQQQPQSRSGTVPGHDEHGVNNSVIVPASGRAAVRRREAVSALVEVFSQLLTIAGTVMDHYELGSTLVVPPAIIEAVKTLDRLVDVLGDVVDHLVSQCDDVSSATEVLSALAIASSAHAAALSPLADRSLGILRRYGSVPMVDSAPAPHSSSAAPAASTANAAPLSDVGHAHTHTTTTTTTSSRERLNDVVRASMLARNKAIMEQYRAKPRNEHAASMLTETLKDVKEVCRSARREMAASSGDTASPGAQHPDQPYATVTAASPDVLSLRAMVPDLLIVVATSDPVASGRTEQEVQREAAVRSLLAETLQDVFDTLSGARRV